MMSHIKIHGAPINTRQAFLAIIEDMRKTAAAKDMTLDMECWAAQSGGVCYACAGGSAVIHGMRGARSADRWTKKQSIVAEFINFVRIGDMDRASLCAPLPDDAGEYWSPAMKDQEHPDFWKAWSRFAMALPSAPGWVDTMFKVGDKVRPEIYVPCEDNIKEDVVTIVKETARTLVTSDGRKWTKSGYLWGTANAPWEAYHPTIRKVRDEA